MLVFFVNKGEPNGGNPALHMTVHEVCAYCVREDTFTHSLRDSGDKRSSLTKNNRLFWLPFYSSLWDSFEFFMLYHVFCSVPRLLRRFFLLGWTSQRCMERVLSTMQLSGELCRKCGWNCSDPIWWQSQLSMQVFPVLLDFIIFYEVYFLVKICKMTIQNKNIS